MSGAAKHLTESVIQSGKEWLASRFAGHQEKAQEKAQHNAEHFAYGLALKVDQLEQDQRIDRSIIDRALEEPSFGALLQSALISSAQTDSEVKHDLLSSIVSARLTAAPESLFSVASQMATSAIVHCSPQQLRFLGFCASTTLIWGGLPKAVQSKEDLVRISQPWFELRFTPYVDLNVGHLDLIHLEAVSCLSRNLIWTLVLDEEIGTRWSAGPHKLTADDLNAYSVGASIHRIWESAARVCHITSIGHLIGILVSDQLCNAKATNLGEVWLA